MQLVTTPAVVEHIQAHGGKLYVWPLKAACCGGSIELRAATEQPAKAFRRLDVDEIELYMAAGMRDPESLHLELGRRGRVRAYWNGLAWVI